MYRNDLVRPLGVKRTRSKNFRPEKSLIPLCSLTYANLDSVHLISCHFNCTRPYIIPLPFQVSIYAVPEKIGQVHHALETTVKLLDFYQSYFEIQYPLKKLGKNSTMPPISLTIIT